MEKAKVGALTVGQSPRTDITIDLPDFLRRQIELVEFGALDRYTLEEVEALPKMDGDYLLTSRMRSGEEVHVSRSHVLSELQRGIQVLERMGVKLILVFCTGELGALHSSVPLLEPNILLREVVPQYTQKKHVITIAPSENQITQSEQRWRQRMPGFSFTAMAVSPYQQLWDFKHAARQINLLKDADLVIMDCLGFTCQMKEMLEAQCDKRVLLPREILFQTAADILKIRKGGTEI